MNVTVTFIFKVSANVIVLQILCFRIKSRIYNILNNIYLTIILDFAGYECHDCGLSSHKKCLEALALQCGHKRLPRRMTTFGVRLSDHLQETGAQVPPLVCKCVHNIDATGSIKIKGKCSSIKNFLSSKSRLLDNSLFKIYLTDIVR